MTLLEVLVALVIASFVVVLLTQALYQVMRLERNLAEQRPEITEQTLRSLMLDRLVRGIVARRSEEPGAFRGRASGFNAISVSVPGRDGPNTAQFGIELVHRQEPDQMELKLTSEGADAVVLLQWPGDKGVIAYLDAQGRWQSQWEMSSDPRQPALPAAIALQTGRADVKNLILPIVATPLPPFSRRQFEKL